MIQYELKKESDVNLMNKEYIYSDGNVIIRDYDDNQKRTLYYDHLDDVLILENLIEVTEEKINLLENKKSQLKKRMKD